MAIFSVNPNLAVSGSQAVIEIENKSLVHYLFLLPDLSFGTIKNNKKNSAENINETIKTSFILISLV